MFAISCSLRSKDASADKVRGQKAPLSREERIEIQPRLRGRRQHCLRDRLQRRVKLDLLHVLQHHALAALFTHNPFIVR